MEAGLIPDYASSVLIDKASKKRYSSKLELVNGLDPYEIPRSEWQDDADLWPAVTHVHVYMYLILTPSPYSEKDLLNYKSLDCYKNFIKGWVRVVLVNPVDDTRIVIAKVRYSMIHLMVVKSIILYHMQIKGASALK